MCGTGEVCSQTRLLLNRLRLTKPMAQANRPRAMPPKLRTPKFPLPPGWGRAVPTGTRGDGVSVGPEEEVAVNWAGVLVRKPTGEAVGLLPGVMENTGVFVAGGVKVRVMPGIGELVGLTVGVGELVNWGGMVGGGVSVGTCVGTGVSVGMLVLVAEGIGEAVGVTSCANSSRSW